MHKCTASADGRFQQRAVEILIERNMPHQYLTFKNFPRNTTRPLPLQPGETSYPGWSSAQGREGQASPHPTPATPRHPGLTTMAHLQGVLVGKEIVRKLQPTDCLVTSL